MKTKSDKKNGRINWMNKISEFLKKQSTRAYMAMGIVVFALTYMLFITFIQVPEKNHDLAVQSLSYVQSALFVVLGYYFGSKKIDEEVKNVGQ